MPSMRCLPHIPDWWDYGPHKALATMRDSVMIMSVDVLHLVDKSKFSARCFHQHRDFNIEN